MRHNQSMLRLVETDEPPVEALTGEQVLRQVADLIEERLPAVPLDDRFRGALATIALAAPARHRSARTLR